MTEINQRVVIVGEAPGRRDAGTTPLFGTNASHAGWRLREIVGLTRTEWMRVRRVNLFATLPVRWDRHVAETTARAWMHALLRGHRVVCCGRRVSAAFGCADLEPFTWREHRGGLSGPTLLASIPHPSGRSLAYNDPRVRMRARRFLRHVLLGEWP